MAGPLRRIGVRWNPHHGQSPIILPPCTLSINIALGQPYQQWIDEAVAHGHSVYCVFGHEAIGQSFRPTVDFVNALGDGLAHFLDVNVGKVNAVTGQNEWNDWAWGVGGIAPQMVRTIDQRMHNIAKSYRVPYATCSTLSHDWGGGNVGYLDFQRVYPEGTPYAEFVDAHMYAGRLDSLRNLAQGWSANTPLPLIIGEFGTQIGEDIPVRAMLDIVLASPRVATALLFCLEDWGDANKRYGLLREDGSRKPAWDEFVQYANKHKEEEKPVPEAPVRVILVPSIQQNRLYPKPGDGDYAESEGDFASWFCVNVLLPVLKAVRIDTVIDQGTYTPGDDLGPLYVQRDRIVAYAKTHPQQKILVVSIHTEGAKYEPNLFGGRYLGSESYKLLSKIADELAKVHSITAKRYMLDGAGYILLDGYPANCVNAIVEVAGDSTVDKVRFLSQRANDLAFAIKNGIVNYIGGAPAPVDWQKRAEDAEMEVARLKHVGQSEAAELDMIAASLRAAADRLATVAKELKA